MLEGRGTTWRHMAARGTDKWTELLDFKAKVSKKHYKIRPGSTVTVRDRTEFWFNCFDVS